MLFCPLPEKAIVRTFIVRRTVECIVDADRGRRAGNDQYLPEPPEDAQVNDKKEIFVGRFQDAPHYDKCLHATS